MRDLLRHEDNFNMDDLMAKMRHHRVDDKVAFKIINENGKPGHNMGTKESKSMSPSKNGRPVSEPTVGGLNKKSINYRIKNNVIKR